MVVLSRLSVAVPAFAVFLAPVLGAATQDQYDYVIVGGGLTGLVVANRLSEDKSKTVLVIEGGESVDTDATTIPYKANDLTASNGLTWDGLVSQPEPALGNVTAPVIVAKVLGGGSVINGMVYDRGSAADYDAWEALGNKNWGWKGLEPYFIKGTTFQPPSAQVARDFNITWDKSTYGKGPLKVSITDTQYADIKDYWAAYRASGVHLPIDGNNGEAYGASWYPNTMDKTTGKRAHARYAYYDPISKRSNLKILTSTTAQKIIWEDKKDATAKGVEITDKAGKTYTVLAKKEVVLAAGAIQTPKLLQLSGVGPKSVLEAAGVKVRVANDGVGSNFQDHPWAGFVAQTTPVAFPNVNSLATDPAFNASAWAQYVANKTGPYTYARGNALAFIPLSDMTNKVNSIVSTIDKQKEGDYLPKIYQKNKKLLAGFESQRKVIREIFKRKDAAVAEFSVPADAAFGLVAVEKPLSRGTVFINAKNPTGAPDILHNAFLNPVDKVIMATAIRWYRTVLARPEVAKFNIFELVPGAQNVSDEDIFNALLAGGTLSPTLAHPSGSCAMMPEKDGGVVDDKLRVYGTKKLSIIDASIIPIIPSCHLQATMYGVAEKAADLIKSRS